MQEKYTLLFFLCWLDIFEFLQSCFVGWTAFLGAEISSHFVLFGIFVFFVSFCVLWCAKKSEGVSVCDNAKENGFCLPKTNVRKMHSFCLFFWWCLVKFEFLAFVCRLGEKLFLEQKILLTNQNKPTNIFSFLFCFVVLLFLFATFVRIFLPQESFSPNKTKLKETIQSSKKKEKECIFLALVIEWQNDCFCFARNLLTSHPKFGVAAKTETKKKKRQIKSGGRSWEPKWLLMQSLKNCWRFVVKDQESMWNWRRMGSSFSVLAQGKLEARVKFCGEFFLFCHKPKNNSLFFFFWATGGRRWWTILSSFAHF